MALFVKPTYKIQAQIVISSSPLQPRICLFNSGAGLNIAGETFLLRELSMRIRSQSVPNLRSAIKKPIQPLGKALLFIRIGDLIIKVWYGIAPNLAVDVLHDIPFIDRFIRGIFSGERSVAPWHSVSVPILTK